MTDSDERGQADVHYYIEDVEISSDAMDELNRRLDEAGEGSELVLDLVFEDDGDGASA